MTGTAEFSADSQVDRFDKQGTCVDRSEFSADLRKDCLCCFEKAKFEGLDDKDFPALTAYLAAASASSSNHVESGSGGTGALDQTRQYREGRLRQLGTEDGTDSSEEAGRVWVWRILLIRSLLLGMGMSRVICIVHHL